MLNWALSGDILRLLRTNSLSRIVSFHLTDYFQIIHKPTSTIRISEWLDFIFNFKHMVEAQSSLNTEQMVYLSYAKTPKHQIGNPRAMLSI